MLFAVIAENQDGTLKVMAEEEGAVLTVTLKTPCSYFPELCALPAYYPVKRSEAEADGAQGNRTDAWSREAGFVTNGAYTVEEWPELCALPAYYPVKRSEAEADGAQGNRTDAWSREAGFVTNGAYTVEEWKHGQSITLQKNPYYHRADEVSESTVKIMLSTDAEAVLTAYNDGDVQFMDEIPVSGLRNLAESPEFHAGDSFGTYYLSLNVTSELFAGKTPAQANAMRRAFALLADRDYICDYIVRAGQQPANSLIPADMKDGQDGVFRKNDSDYTYADVGTTGYFNPFWSEENIAEAISLLTFAGYRFEEGMLSEETPLVFTYLIDGEENSGAIAEALQQDFAAVGIEMQIKMLEGNAFSNAKKYGRYDAVTGENRALYNNPLSLLEQWSSESERNECFLGK